MSFKRPFALLAAALILAVCAEARSWEQGFPIRLDSGVLEMTRRGVVHVSTGDGAGSGFFASIGGTTICITNRHVIASALVPLERGHSRQIARILLRTAAGAEVQAQVWKSSKSFDIALLIPDFIPQGARPLEIDERLPRIGHSVIAWGAPYGEALVPMDGLVRDVLTGRRAIQSAGGPFDVIQVGISVAPGSSGGPLLAWNGKVIGVISRRGETHDGTSTGESFAIAARVFWPQAQSFAPPFPAPLHRPQ